VARQLDGTSNDQFFKEMKKYPVRLKREETIDLARKAQAGDEDARERLIGGHLAYVVGVAKKWARNGRTVDDMIQYGCLGLMQALDTFDPDMGHHFLTHARWQVRYCIQRGCAESGVVCLPQRSYMDELGVTKDLHLLHAAKERPRELNAPLSPDSDTEYIDMMASDLPAPDEQVDHDLLRTSVDRIMRETLTARQYDIIRRRMNGDNFYEVGRDLGISHQAASDATRKGYRRLALTSLAGEAILRVG